MARADAIGFFWQDIPADGKRGNAVRNMPPIPDTGWTPPTYFPDLSSAPCISLDTETWDPELVDYRDSEGESAKGKGPGWARGKGHIVGVSIGVPGGHKWYFPMRHEVEPEHNLPPESVLAWLRVTLGNSEQPKIGANLTYDIGWLKQEGVDVRGELVDVQFAEALLDERAEVALEVMATKYLGVGKETSLLYRWCADFYGGAATDRQRANIYRSPPRLVGPYAEADADLPLRIAPVVYQRLEKEGLLGLFKMECGLIPLLISMRFAGVAVNIEKAEELRGTLLRREEAELQRMKHQVGFHVDINASASLAKAFDSAGLAYARTAPTKNHPNGQPSFTKEFLKGLNHPLAKHINEVRKLAKLRGTFVESYILNSHVDGKVYGQFHPMRGDEGGTRSGRFSSSAPNLQNLPSRDEELAPMVRGLFVPDYGHACWRKYDYSQIEYRFLIHYAVGPGSEEARARFCAEPDTDYHEWTLDLIAPMAGWDVSSAEKRKPHRKPTKNVNFGMIYGMGEGTLAMQLGLKPKEAKTFFKAYDQGVPFAKPTMNAAMEEAQQTGRVRTILGRTSHFDQWEPAKWGTDGPALPYERALMQYGNIQRAYTHKALNRRLQGSAADLMKKAMLLCWEQGIFDATGVPRLTVHDELDFSVADKSPETIEAFKELRHVLENAIPLRIPVRADAEEGPDWGHVQDVTD